MARDTVNASGGASLVSVVPAPSVAPRRTTVGRYSLLRTISARGLMTLVKTTDGTIIALDGKVTLDGNAAFRHPEWAQYADDAAEDPLELKARQKSA